ncbi:MAG: aminotransferase class I/II-fold pyridoxal phosphate-dependent enzyme, partial [Chlamydiota bacterium]|nr:aminotransferase class I/II-fold pyridoxal phosphate-dependent enzyme [Chlamydiota bacterium]
GDLIILDKINHASIIDASLLSGARIKTYRHRDMEDLENVLRQTSQYERRLLVTESVFSMEGDIAPLPDISRLCRSHNVLMMIDEAHATGVLGERGTGALEHFHMKTGSVDIVMGTLSKALGSQGGFVCADQVMIDYLINKSRPFIYTTALSPASCASALKAVEIIKHSSVLKERLLERHSYLLRAMLSVGLRPTSDEFPICSVITGDDANTVKISNGLLDAGIFAPAIRPPTVPEGQGRIRLSLMASHTRLQIDQTVDVLARLINI